MSIDTYTLQDPFKSVISLTQALCYRAMSSSKVRHYVILFYKYSPLSDDESIMQQYSKALQKLCSAVDLTGRILIGVSSNAEGINGTLAGTDKTNVFSFTYALLGLDWCKRNAGELKGVSLPLLYSGDAPKCNERQVDQKRTAAILAFWNDCCKFSNISGVDPPRMDTPEDFKWSTTESEENQLFPDLNIKLVKEIISTGGLLSSVGIDETSKDYLTPQEWHEEMRKLKLLKQAKDTVLIDCRNHKEYAIGHFENSIDPNTKTFAQFPRWVQENKSSLKDKNILMYCTVSQLKWLLHFTKVYFW